MTITTRIVKPYYSPEVKYPALMKIKNLEVIVLFASKGAGMTIHSAPEHDCHSVGEWSTNWDMSDFEPYNGIVRMRQVP